MSIIDWFTRRRDPEERAETFVLHECRHCGVSVEPATTTCPECDATEIARYELPPPSDDHPP